MGTISDPDADLITAIERFLSSHDMPPTTFGRRSIGDANLIDDLRAGRELRRATRQKVRAFMQGQSVAKVLICSECEARADHPSVSSCTSPHCPLARGEQEAA